MHCKREIRDWVADRRRWRALSHISNAQWQTAKNIIKNADNLVPIVTFLTQQHNKANSKWKKNVNVRAGIPLWKYLAKEMMERKNQQNNGKETCEKYREVANWATTMIDQVLIAKKLDRIYREISSEAQE